MGGATRQPGAATHPLTTAAPRRELCRHRAQMSHPDADRAGGRGHRQLRCLAQRGGCDRSAMCFLRCGLEGPTRTDGAGTSTDSDRGSGPLTMLPNSKSPHTGKEPVTGSFRPPPP